MTAPHCHTTDEVKANINKISRNSGAGDNMGPSKGIGGSSSSVATTHTEEVEPTSSGSDSKRSI